MHTGAWRRANILAKLCWPFKRFETIGGRKPFDFPRFHGIYREHAGPFAWPGTNVFAEY
jgi:hypothetical protein